MVRQMITLGNGQTVEAEIIGQLGVHQDTDNEHWWNVTHVKSGGFIAVFSYDLDALDFARKVGDLLDFDNFSTAIANSSTKSARRLFYKEIEAVKTLRSSYITYIPESMNRREMKQNEIKARVKN